MIGRGLGVGAPTQPTIGLLGPTGVGKTTYLAVLEAAFVKQGCNVDISSDMPDPRQSTSLSRATIQLTNQANWPAKTDPLAALENLFMRVTKDGRPVVNISFFDPGGELFEPGVAESKPQFDQLNALYAHIAACSAFVLLVDLQRWLPDSYTSLNLTRETLSQYLRRNQLQHHLSADNVLNARAAVVITKADLLDWLREHRTREADAWLEDKDAPQALHELAQYARRMFTDVRFFFCSSVGWSEGRPNCHTVVVPPPLTTHGGSADPADLIGDLIPDPPPSQVRFKGAEGHPRLPAFSDPLQLVSAAEFDKERAERPGPGVYVLPGRRLPSMEGTERSWTGWAQPAPWNVVEPLLWVAGVTL